MLPKIKEFSDYDQYATEQDYTTSAQAQEYFGNQNECLKGVIRNYWQPETNYVFGDIVYSPELPTNIHARCVKGGKTSTTEQSWGDVGDDIVDGTAIWRVEYKNAIKNGLTIGSQRERANKPTYGL